MPTENTTNIECTEHVPDATLIYINSNMSSIARWECNCSNTEWIGPRCDFLGQCVVQNAFCARPVGRTFCRWDSLAARAC